MLAGSRMPCQWIDVSSSRRVGDAQRHRVAFAPPQRRAGQRAVDRQGGPRPAGQVGGRGADAQIELGSGQHRRAGGGRRLRRGRRAAEHAHAGRHPGHRQPFHKLTSRRLHRHYSNSRHVRDVLTARRSGHADERRLESITPRGVTVEDGHRRRAPCWSGSDPKDEWGTSRRRRERLPDEGGADATHVTNGRNRDEDRERRRRADQCRDVGAACGGRGGGAGAWCGHSSRGRRRRWTRWRGSILRSGARSGWGEAARADADCPAGIAWCMCSCADASAAGAASGVAAAIAPCVIMPGTQMTAHASSNDGVPAKHTISTRLITRRGRKVTIRVYPPRLDRWRQ